MTSLPRKINSKRAELGKAVAAGYLTDADAGTALADFIESTYPDIYRAIVRNWCTARFRRYNPLPAGWVQASLFPASKWYAPLSEAVEYAESQRSLTGRFSDRDAMRAAALKQLIAAAGGDLSMPLDRAYRLAHPEEEEEETG